MFCKKCGMKIPEESNFCQFCGEAIEEVQTKKNASKNLIVFLSIVSVILLTIATVILVLDPFHFFRLSESEEKCYELMLDVSREFNNPSSVQIVSGQLNYYPEVDKNYVSAYLKLSAKNSFNATTSGYYFVGYEDSGELFIYDLEYFGEDNPSYDSSIESCKRTDSFNIKKVNDALRKYWNNN